MTRRILKWLGVVVAVMLALPLLLAGAALLALNTGVGQRLLEGQVPSLSGGLVKLSGVHGAFPGAPRVDRIEVRDSQGVWLAIDHAALDWSPLALLSGAARIESLAASRITVTRLPAGDGKAQASSSGGSFQLPVRLDAARVHVDLIELAAPVAGAPVSVSLDGVVHVAALDAGEADLTITAPDGGGRYHLSGRIDPAMLSATIDAAEPAAGLAARLARLPDLGALSVRGSAEGPWNAVVATMTLAAGEARAEARGTIDAKGSALDVTVKATAPAMRPATGVAWHSAALDAHVRGPFATPDANGTLRLDGLRAGGAELRVLAADLSGDRGRVGLRARAEGVRIPGPKPDLLESDPVLLVVDAKLDDPARPVVFDLSHTLLHAAGTARTGDALSARAHLDLPDLSRLAVLGGIDLQGRSSLDITAALPGEATDVTLDGIVGITGGLAPAPALLGPEARLGVTASLRGSDMTLTRLELAGRALTLSAKGGLADGRAEATADVSLPDLHAAQPTLEGAAMLHVQASGPTDDLSLVADLAGDIGTNGVPRGRVVARVDARGLPGAPQGRVEASGQLDGAPLQFATELARGADGTLSATIEHADWRSAHAEGHAVLAKDATLPAGRFVLRMSRLDDLRRLTGLALTGGVDATVDMADQGGRPVVVAKVLADRAGLPGTASAGRLTLDARVVDPLGALSVDASLVADSIEAAGVAGGARLAVTGPRQALGIKLSATAQTSPAGPVKVDTQAMLDLDARSLSVASLQAAARGETVRLLAPARISFGGAVAVDRLRVGLRQAVLDIAGRVSPTLDLTASLRGVTADLARIADPALRADGTLSADARLTGTPDRPAGTIRVQASGLHLRQGPASGLPPASVTADARLSGRQATIDARLAAGRSQLALSGTAPIDPAAAMDLRATGGIDLALLDPVLTPAGRRARGQISIDAAVAGTLAAPRATGSLRLAGGEIQDFGQGVRIADIQGLIQATGDRIEIAHLTGRAGQGTISATGSVGLAAPMPVDLRLTMKNATPLASDRLTAVLDSDLRLRGALAGRLDAAGGLTIRRANIQIPDRLPGSVAVLDVRRPGDKPPPPSAPGPDIGLDLTVESPGQIFVRGRGIDAELQGRLRVRGTAAAPQPEGGFQMRRGNISVAGQTLTFTTGRVGFDGSGKIDPTLDFLASTTAGSVTANLQVGGYASAPKITLSSVPELPQDEVLARLLFGQSASSLGPFQLGEIALALAQLTGAPGSGFDPLGSARKALGLDRLSVGGGSGGSSGGATVEAGRYVADGVYVGAKQGTSGGGTQAQVQVDLYKGLKLEADVGTGGGSATGSSGSSSSGTSVGLTYQFEY